MSAFLSKVGKITTWQFLVGAVLGALATYYYLQRNRFDLYSSLLGGFRNRPRVAAPIRVPEPHLEDLTDLADLADPEPDDEVSGEGEGEVAPFANA